MAENETGNGSGGGGSGGGGAEATKISLARLLSSVNMDNIEKARPLIQGRREVVLDEETLKAQKEPEVSPEERFVSSVAAIAFNLDKTEDRFDKQSIKTLVDRLDKIIDAQLNEVLHHPTFQQMEASWRSVADLVRNTNFKANIQLSILDVSKEGGGRGPRAQLHRHLGLRAVQEAVHLRVRPVRRRALRRGHRALRVPQLPRRHALAGEHGEGGGGLARPLRGEPRPRVLRRLQHHGRRGPAPGHRGHAGHPALLPLEQAAGDRRGGLPGPDHAALHRAGAVQRRHEPGQRDQVRRGGPGRRGVGVPLGPLVHALRPEPGALLRDLGLVPVHPGPQGGRPDLGPAGAQLQRPG
jgi:hypothetical protein